MLGYSFLRQRPIYKYIVDFYCPQLKLGSRSMVRAVERSLQGIKSGRRTGKSRPECIEVS
jgi:hypothetical protein